MNLVLYNSKYQAPLIQSIRLLYRSVSCEQECLGPFCHWLKKPDFHSRTSHVAGEISSAKVENKLNSKFLHLFSEAVVSDGHLPKQVVAEYTIMQKMADQARSDLDVVFTMILCATNFLFGKLCSSYSQISF